MAVPPESFRVVERKLDPAELIAAVAGPDRGAIASFIGAVRDHHAGRRVLRMEYHAYPSMAEQVMREIGAEVERRFGTPHVAIHHRIGMMAIGDVSVIIAIAAAHRREALDACRFAIERLKATVPIWKKEFYDERVSWIEGSEEPSKC